MIKYQKSTMKIMEMSLLSGGSGYTINKMISETHAGRTATFSALKWLEENGFIRIENLGKQKIIYPVIDNYTLQFKYFSDTFKFKSLHPFVKLIARLAVGKLTEEKEIKYAVLFGSAVKNNSIEKILQSDIDLLVIGKKEAGEALLRLREQIERIFGIIINFHFSDFSVRELFRGLVIYQQSFIDLRNPAERQYFEFLDWFFAAFKAVGNKEMYSNYLEKAKINLAFCYSLLQCHSSLSKKEALELFSSKKKTDSIDDIKNRGVEIGQE